MKSYPNLFKKGKLGRITTKNRIILSPMGDNMANADGSVSEQSLAYYTERAKGGVGVVIPGVVSVDYPQGKTITCQHRLDAAKYVKGWERLSRAVHRYGALLIPQIHHAGMSTETESTEGMIPLRVSPEDKSASEDRAVIASHLDSAVVKEKVLTVEEIKELEQKFIKCAKYAQMANCDGVEIHGAHGYLIAQFLTPGVNNRTDEYGGSLENRMRFAVNIIRGIRENCGPNFIIGIRMPVHKWSSDCLTDEESKEMAKAFEAAGCDFLDISGGFAPALSYLVESQKRPQGARLDLLQKIKGEVKIPIFGPGVLREPDFCEKVLADGTADFVCMGRALLADPYWPEKAKAGKANEIRKCISCLDGCFGNLAKNQSIRCVINPEVGYESELNHATDEVTPKRVVVVGGGVGGMQAAITATKKGHKVTLLEKTDKLGGQLNIACIPPHKQYINWATEWFVGELDRNYISVKYNCDADLEYIKSLNPDTVIIATGAKPWAPGIPGIEKGVQAWDILNGTAKTPENKNVTVIGGGIVGCETSLFLAERGNKITIIEMLPNIATGLEMANKLDLLEDFKEIGVTVETLAVVKEIQDTKVVFEKNGVQNSVDSDFTLLAIGQRSCGLELVDQLEEAGIDVVIIGDAKKPAKIVHATTDGFFAALDL